MFGRLPHVLMRRALAEADRRGEARVTSTHILFACLVDSTSECVRAAGVTLVDARAALDELDAAALRSVGVDIPPAYLSHTSSRLHLSDSAVRVLRRASKAAATSRDHFDKYLFLEVLDLARPDPAAALIDALVDRDSVRARL